jgi:hypothetical protein
VGLLAVVAEVVEGTMLLPTGTTGAYPGPAAKERIEKLSEGHTEYATLHTPTSLDSREPQAEA